MYNKWFRSLTKKTILLNTFVAAWLRKFNQSARKKNKQQQILAQIRLLFFAVFFQMVTRTPGCAVTHLKLLNCYDSQD